jgi:hypothetical protein
VSLLQPSAQPLALINWLPQAQHLPRNHAHQGDKQHGQRDLDPLSHGGSMSLKWVEIEQTCIWPKEARVSGPRLGRQWCHEQEFVSRFRCGCCPNVEVPNVDILHLQTQLLPCMARYRRSTLINANRYATAASYILQTLAKKAKKNIKERKRVASRKMGFVSE